MMQVAVLHPRFDVIGGAELVSLHVMRHLLERGDRVRLVTLAPPAAGAARQEAGLDLGHPNVELHVVPSLPGRARALLDSAWMQRRARPVARASDLWVSTYNEANLGHRGLQYVHHPLFADRRLLRRYRISDQASGPVQRLYDAGTRRLAGARPAAYRANESLTNSAFMADVLREAYGLDAAVLYPAFLTTPPATDGERAHRMVSVGRIAPDKHTSHLVDLMAEVHRAVPDLTFVIAGFVADPAYFEAVRARATARGLPVEFRTDLRRDAVAGLLRSSRYFLSAKPYEHFGITTLEAAHAGALPFVHRSGGSLEIVRDPRLAYETGAELATQVEAVVASERLRQEIEAALRTGLDRFQRHHFDRGLDAAIERTLRVRVGRP